MNLFHPKKGELTPAGKKFSPLKGVVPLYADKNGRKTELDGTEKPIDEILKTHDENQAQTQEQEKEQKLNEMQDEMDFEKNLDEQDKNEAENEAETRMHTEVLSEVKQASEAIVEAVKAIPETVVPEFPDHYKEQEKWQKEQEKWQKEVLKVLKKELPEADYTPIVEAVNKIKFPEFPQPIDYTKALESIKKSLPKETDNSGVIEAINNIQFPEFPKFKFTKNGSLRVALDEMAVATGGGGDTSKLATEETLQKIAGVNYDTTSVDMSNPSNIVVTYSLAGVTVSTETISKVGATFNIVKS